MFNEEKDMEEKTVSPTIDHFDRYFESTVKVSISTGPSITGKLVEIDPVWIVISKSDEDEVSIRKKHVVAIGEVEPR